MPRLKASLFVTCLGDVLFPNVGTATVQLLRRLGVEVDFPASQTCCGQPHFNSGYHQDARAIAKHTLAAFARSERVVIPSGSCAAMVKREMPHLLRDEPTWHARALEMAGKSFELSELLTRVLNVEDVGASYPIRATYHMSCHLRALGLTDEPLRLLRRVRGLELVPLERHDECCGFGGSFSVRYPLISQAMTEDKCRLIAATGAQAVIATDSGCLMNMGGCLRRQARGSVRTLHLAEVLERVD
jgi:L-lactate dehydrogenase complex protein LldE